MSHEERDYVGILRANGYRVTPQRLLVLDAVCALEGHATIAAIQEQVEFFDPSINRSTVYRALEVLTEVGLILEAELEDMKIYRLAGEANHHHLSCKHCHQVFSIPQEALANFVAEIEKLYGFLIDADHLVLQGLCPNCRQISIKS